MTKIEYMRCTGLMIDAIAHAKISDEAFKESRNQNLSKVQQNVQELRGQNNLGYAEAINTALVVLGFKHDRMKELNDLLK